ALAEWLGDVLPHLVAARPDSGADRCQRRSGYGSNAVLQDAFDEPAPADVEDDEPRSSLLAREDDGEAVRGQEAERAVGPLGPEAVALLEVGAGGDDSPPVRLKDARAVDLPGHRRLLGVGPDGAGEDAAVLDNPAGLVVGEDAEVQGCEVALAHAPLPRREGGEVCVADVVLQEPHAGPAGAAMSSFA